MKSKKLLVSLLSCVLAANLFAVTVFAAKEDGGSKDDSTSSDDTTSEWIVTIPEDLYDGNYAATVIVEPDDDDGFNFYYITVTVAMEDGALTSFSVSGASGSNTQYSYRAETGLNEQLTGKTAGSYEVDAVSTATCSSKAMVEAINEALVNERVTDQSFTLGDAYYDPDGTTVILTITTPDESYTAEDVAIAYAVGKFSSDLTQGTDYDVELVSSSDDEIIFAITINDVTAYIEDDDLTHEIVYNSLGMSLDVTVADCSAGRIEILSSAEVTLTNNNLSLTGGNGETLSDYLDSIDEITVVYTDEEGNEISTTYSTQWQHDTEPEYTADDFFNEDGTVNFDITPFVYGAETDYTITISASGFDDLTAIVGLSSVVEDDTEEETDDSSDSSDSSDDDATTDYPDTSDSSNLLLWLAAMFGGVMLLGFIARRRMI